jgi:hypothetical protein
MDRVKSATAKKTLPVFQWQRILSHQRSTYGETRTPLYSGAVKPFISAICPQFVNYSATFARPVARAWKSSLCEIRQQKSSAKLKPANVALPNTNRSYKSF